ncbi:hypothetical protein ABE237_06590 [Brevibacillus formosus]|uniref:hypothetical protein n=1 Tax=Brevibacillus formosus TaxID=54913 RepID=UPI0018CCFCA1|nr:hypothetical protein [Brevibacillus formosus]MBG9943863.1 hypothetical protein [Brevibacillus formosus]
MKKRLARITALSTVLGTLTLSASIGLAADEDRVKPMGDGTDFSITGKRSWADGADNLVTLSAYTEGKGRDLAKVRVYSYFYINGNLKHQDYDNDPTYASVEYEKQVSNLIDTEIRSSHYAYNKFGDKEERVSEDYWPK